MVIPVGFTEISPAKHPGNGTTGVLIRNEKDGTYFLWDGRALSRVPRKWAADLAAELGKGADAIQEACIARMTELGLNANQLAMELQGKVSRSNVMDYLSRRRGGLGSYKLQHLLLALDRENDLKWLARRLFSFAGRKG